ncbi:MAG: DUF4097 family beta strand repeat-containing protein [Gemmatimonadaceae bacterium]
MGHKFKSFLAGSAVALALGGATAAEAQSRPPTPPRTPSRWFQGSRGGAARIDTLVPFSANGSVELGLISGSIKVTAWNRNEARVVASATDGGALDFDATGSHIDLSVHHNWSDRHGSATYEVTVPMGARITVSAVSGTISATGVHGGIDASSVSGSVSVRDAGANVAIENVSGDITAIGIAGDVKVEAVSGNVRVSNVTGTVSAENVSGNIDVSNVRGTRVRANSVSGNVDFAGAMNPAGRYDFETHSGRTVLQLGGGTAATITVNTHSGSVTNEYPGAVSRSESDTDDGQTSYRYTIGRGDARVSIETFSGRVQISQEDR